MRNRRKSSFFFGCLICDYWYLILFVLLVIVWGIWFSNHQLPGDSTYEPVSPTSTPLVGGFPVNATLTPTEISANPEPAITTTPLPEEPAKKPDYVIAFIPVEWDDNIADFQTIALRHFYFFVDKSDIDDYFDVQISFIEQDESLITNSEELVTDLILYGVSETPADRYVGITTADLALGDDSDVAGWTMGDDCQGAIAEYSDEEITAHELGHTFGLCDEYSMEAWQNQNDYLENGCPNSLDTACELGELCIGVAPPRGGNSMMGVAGFDGDYDYNLQCKKALLIRFETLSGGTNP